jgi:sigma-B regulation protein RsbU (phosphoserine phosphatase)
VTQDLVVPAQPDQLKVLRDHTRSHLKDLMLDSKIAFRLVLGVDEACQNIMRHAFTDHQGKILSRIQIQTDTITFNLFDNGARDPSGPLIPSKPLATSEKDMSMGGMGLHFIEKIFDHYRFEHVTQGDYTHQLTLVYTINESA